jgi:hypothetical protein
MDQEFEAFQRGQLIDHNYNSGIRFSIEMLKDLYNIPEGPIGKTSKNPDDNRLYGVDISNQLMTRGKNGQEPVEIIKEWQIPYAIGILSHF